MITWKPAVGIIDATKRKRICWHWCYINESKENRGLYIDNQTNNYHLTKPDQLFAYISVRNGHYNSYYDPSVGYLQDLTQDLSVEFDHYLIEITGATSNKLYTN